MNKVLTLSVILLGSLVTPVHATSYEETVNRFCAYVVGIPYASDNFTDEEWKRFEFCRNTLTK